MKLSLVKLSFVTFITVLLFHTGNAQQIQPPSLKYVSVDPLTDNVTIAWYASPEANVDSLLISHITTTKPSVSGAILHYVKPNIDGSYTVNVSKIVSIGTNTVLSPLSFSIDAIVGGVQSTNLGNYQTTIFARSTFQNCPLQNIISWTKYKGNGTQVNKYNIYKLDSVSSTLLGSVPATDTSFSHVLNGLGNGTYTYFVEAVLFDVKSAAQTSTSNKTSISVVLPNYPTSITGKYSQVIANDSIKLVFGVGYYDIRHYQVYTSDSLAGPYLPTKWGDERKTTKSELIFYDHDSGTVFKKKYYKLNAISPCGDIVASSNVISNIILFANKATNANEIIWSNYESWDKGIDRYELSRSIDNANPAPVLYIEREVAQKSYSFTDNLEVLAGAGNEQCYYVIAYPLKEKDPLIKSISNTSCIKQDDRIFIPDAFNPVSKVLGNKVFRPFIAYIRDNVYELSIYNRLSENVFTTTDPTKGWDGMFKNELVAEGTYVYHIKYKNADNKIIEKRGVLYVIFNEQ